MDESGDIPTDSDYFYGLRQSDYVDLIIRKCSRYVVAVYFW